MQLKLATEQSVATNRGRHILIWCIIRYGGDKVKIPLHLKVMKCRHTPSIGIGS